MPDPAKKYSAYYLNIDKLPPWVTGKLFENILRENVKNFKQIKETNINMYENIAPGENTLTFVTRIEFVIELTDGTIGTEYFMLKLERSQRHFYELLESFAQEPKIYEELIPVFEKLYQDAGHYVKFAAKYYKLPTDKWHVCLEDLCTRGFKVANRFKCLDMQHAKMVLKKMAQWHAASAVHKEHIGSYDDVYIKSAYDSQGFRAMTLFYEGMTKCLITYLHLYENPQKYRKKLKKLVTILMNNLFEVVEVYESEFNVLNHTDLWTNNIMFQYDTDGNLLDTCFLDYTNLKYGSPAQDLLYFIMSSVQVDIKIAQFNNLIEYYHENLVESLKLLKYPKRCPKLKDIHNMLRKYKAWGFFAAIGIMAIALTGPLRVCTFNSILSECHFTEAFRSLMFTNKLYQQHMNVVLPWLLKRGCLRF